MTEDIRDTAARALRTTGLPPSQYEQLLQTRIASKIVADQPLTDEEKREIIETFETPPPQHKHSAWTLKKGLYGGDSHYQTLNPPQPTVDIVAVIEPEASQIFAAKAGTPVHVPLLQIGTVNQVGYLTLLQAGEACKKTVEQVQPPEGVNKWGQKIQSHTLHHLHETLSRNLADYQVPYRDQPWQPAVDTDYTKPLKFKITGIEITGEEPARYTFPTTPILAAREEPEPVRPEFETSLIQQLNQLENEFLTQAETIIGFATDSILDKIGRYITRATRQQDQPPGIAAILASQQDLALVDIDRLAEPIIRDMLTQIERRTQTHINNIISAMQTTLRAEIPATAFKTRLEKALKQLKRHTIGWVKTTVASNNYQTQPPYATPSSAILASFAATAGGGTSSTTTQADDSINRRNPVRSVATGTAALAAIAATYRVWEQVSEQQGPVTGSNGITVLASPLNPEATQIRDAAASTGFNPEFVWTPNHIPIPGRGRTTETHYPQHVPYHFQSFAAPEPVTQDFVTTKKLEDGTEQAVTIEDVTSQPGDHPYCRCAWVVK